MSTFDQFITIIRSFILKAIYVWGGQGEATNEADIRAHETSVENANRAITLYRQRKAQGINPVIKFDCSGLIIYTLLKLGLIGYDTTADGIYDRCRKIAKSALKLGDFTFRLSNDGNAHHIGVVTRKEGGKVFVTESYGRSVGVVEREIDATPDYWEAYGDNPFFADSAQVQGLSASGHVQYIGWQDGTQIIGTVGQGLRMEAVKIHYPGIKYRVHEQDYGWMAWKNDGEQAGVTGESRRIEAIQIVGPVEYRVHVQDIGWMPWCKSGEIAGTTGRSLRVEALEIRLI